MKRHTPTITNKKMKMKKEKEKEKEKKEKERERERERKQTLKDSGRHFGLIKGLIIKDPRAKVEVLELFGIPFGCPNASTVNSWNDNITNISLQFA